MLQLEEGRKTPWGPGNPCKSIRGIIYIEKGREEGTSIAGAQRYLTNIFCLLLWGLSCWLDGDLLGRKEERVTVFNLRALARPVAASLPSKGR